MDVDPASEPDLIASVVDLSGIADRSVDAIWCSHCLEHLFEHEVPVALAEFARILRPGAFACVIVPDLQSIAHLLETDRIHETIYHSAAGPVTAHDMIWGFGPAIAFGKLAMAHHCGFTPTKLIVALQGAGFSEIVIRRRSNLELAALAFSGAVPSPETRDTLMAGLGL